MPLSSFCARNRPGALPSSSSTCAPQTVRPPLLTSQLSKARRPRARSLSHLTSPSATTASAKCMTRTTGDTCTRSSTAPVADLGSPFWMRSPMTECAPACQSFRCAPPAPASTTAQRRAGTTHSPCAATTVDPPPTSLTAPSGVVRPSRRHAASSRTVAS